MEATLHRFVRLLRLGGVRVSIPEALDAMRCAGQPGVLSSRAVLRTALRVALVKDQRDEPIFDEIFDAFFALVRVGGGDTGHGHSHAHDDLVDSGELESFTLSEEPSETPEQGHEHGKPASIRDYFKQEDLAQRYNLHQEANKIDLAALTDEIVFSKDTKSGADDSFRIQLSTDRLSGAATAGSLATSGGTPVDAELTIAEQDALLGWLAEELDADGDETDAAAVRKRLAGILENLPQALKRHLEALLALETKIVESRERREAVLAGSDRLGESERAELEDSLRRLARTLHGALTHRRRAAAAGRVDSGRRCAATCVPTGCRSCRSPCAAPRTGHGWSCWPMSACRCGPRHGSPSTWCTGCRTCSPRSGPLCSSPTSPRPPSCSATIPASARWV